jgi:hypothetical protein
MSQYTRRLEAIPLSWDALSEQQRNAVEAASGWLVDALGSIPPLKDHPEEPRKSGPVLDRNRRSQIGFIDGDRGMGKSSVLLTLQALTSEEDYFVEDNAKNPADKDKAKILNAEEYPSTMKLRDPQRRNNVVWLETLDMEPLSKGANLFAAILARIEKELDDRLGELQPMAAACSEPDGYAGAADKLRQLQNDVAIVWDRKEGGAYEGDPSTRALWVNQAEKAGLEMNQRIGKVLEMMARVRRNRRDENPLYVLPVDDFDLAPCHCLELLRLIRMITTPRLFFLVAGNTRIAEAVLRLRTEGDLLSLTERKPLKPNDVSIHASEIAANNMRKLLPPGQRVRLATLRITEALDNIRADSDSKTDTKEGSLRNKLEAIKFEINQAPTAQAKMSLAYFLLPDEFSIGYLTIAEWLTGTPRQVLDRIEMLGQFAKTDIDCQATDQSSITLSKDFQRQIKKNKRDDRLIVKLFEEIQREISEDALVPFQLRERLVETFNTSVSISLDLSYLRVKQHDSYQELSGSNEFKLVNVTPVGIRVSVATGDYMSQQVEGKEKAKEEATTALPRRLGATLLFAHDFTVSLWGGYLRHSSLMYRSKLGPMVEVRWKTGIEGYVAFGWNTLEWWTFRDCDRFAQHWRQHVDQCNGSYGLAWLAAILEVVLNEPLMLGPKGWDKKRLKGLLKKLVVEEKKPTRTARRLLLNSCLTTIALLLAPESGADINISAFRDQNDEFFTAINSHLIASNIREARAHRWIKTWNNGNIDTQKRASICELIAPGLAWYITAQEVNSLIKRMDLKVDGLPELLGVSDSNKSKTEATADVERSLRELENTQPEAFARINYKLRDEFVPLDKLIKRARICYIYMHSIGYHNIPPYSLPNMLDNRDFTPTEEDIKRVQQ